MSEDEPPLLVWLALLAQRSEQILGSYGRCVRYEITEKVFVYDEPDDPNGRFFLCGIIKPQVSYWDQHYVATEELLCERLLQLLTPESNE